MNWLIIGGSIIVVFSCLLYFLHVDRRNQKQWLITDRIYSIIIDRALSADTPIGVTIKYIENLIDSHNESLVGPKILRKKFELNAAPFQHLVKGQIDNG